MGKDGLANTYHRDGTVTFWSVYEQVWKRLEASDVSAQTLATMNDDERRRIMAMADKARSHKRHLAALARTDSRNGAAQPPPYDIGPDDETDA